MKETIFYRLNNKPPVEDFLDSLSFKEAQKILWVLKLVEELEYVSRPLHKSTKKTTKPPIW